MERELIDKKNEQWVNDLISVDLIEEITNLPSDTEAVIVHNLNDEKIEILAKLNKLRILIQNGNSYITDKGLKTLGKMVSLEELDLEWSDAITDNGLVYLYNLNRLTWLDIDFCCSLTKQGVVNLQTNLRHCEVNSSLVS